MARGCVALTRNEALTSARFSKFVKWRGTLGTNFENQRALATTQCGFSAAFDLKFLKWTRITGAGISNRRHENPQVGRQQGSFPCTSSTPIFTGGRARFSTSSASAELSQAGVNTHGGYDYKRRAGSGPHLNSWAEWFDLDDQFEIMDGLGHQVGVVCSIGPFSVAFSDMPVEEGRDYALMWNEEMAGAQQKYPGRVWASAAVPLQDTRVGARDAGPCGQRLGLMGVNIPGSVGAMRASTRSGWSRCTRGRGARPADVPASDRRDVPDMLEGYNGALHLSLGRVIEVSVAANRLVLSGLMERHPD